MRALILCTGNSCRSQMAEGILRSLRPGWEVVSAGTRPEKEVNPHAVCVMKEIGIDLSSHYPKQVQQFSDQSFDYVITVCDNARESCPVFTGKVDQAVHIGFDDPAATRGSAEEMLPVYRKIRDQIREAFYRFTEEIHEH